MARRAELLNAFSKGVLDPMLYERTDLQQYYQAVRTGRNVLFLPQGGFTLAPGTRLSYAKRLRHEIEPLAISAADITAHNGGDPALLLDQNAATLFTTAAVGASSFVVAEVELDQAEAVTFVDVQGFRCEASRADDALALEYWDGLTWASFGAPGDLTLSPRKNIRTSARTRRFGTAPGVAVTSRQWRIVVYGGEACGAISIAGLRFWKETGRVSPVRLVRFAKSPAEVHQLVLTDRNIDVFDGGLYLASVPVAIDATQVIDVNGEQSQDTLLLFHEDVETPRVVRQGARDEWDAGAMPVTNVPNLTAGTAFSGEQDEVQDIALPAFAAGQRITMLLGDLIAAPFTTTTSGDLEAQIAAALGALPGVVAAGVSVKLTSLAPVTVRVTFSGDNGGRRWPLVFPRVHGATARTWSTTIVQRGLDPDGPVMGATTGWPRCGAVWQARLFLGGFRAAPQTLLASVVNDLYSFLLPGDPATADRALQITLDTDQVETIHEIFVGRHLMIMTDAGEWWSDNRVVDATQPFNVILASRHGIEPSVPVSFSENATLMLQKGGRTLRALSYSADTSASYEAEPLSLLAPHLLTGVVDVAQRPAVSTSEANLVLCLNANGKLCVFNLMRAQQVIAAAVRDTTGGLIKALGDDVRSDLWWIVQRAGELWLEKIAFDVFLDGVVEVAGPASVVTGLAHLEGQQVWAVADQEVTGPYTVSGAAITLTTPAAGSVRVGVWSPAEVETLDLREKLPNEKPFKPPVRIFTVDVSVVAAGNLAVAANNGPLLELALRHTNGAPPPMDRTGEEPTNDALDVPALARLYTGQVRREGIPGWTKHGRVRLTQTRPAPLTVRALRLEAAY